MTEIAADVFLNILAEIECVDDMKLISTYDRASEICRKISQTVQGAPTTCQCSTRFRVQDVDYLQKGCKISKIFNDETLPIGRFRCRSLVIKFNPHGRCSSTDESLLLKFQNLTYIRGGDANCRILCPLNFLWWDGSDTVNLFGDEASVFVDCSHSRRSAVATRCRALHA